MHAIFSWESYELGVALPFEAAAHPTLDNGTLAATASDTPLRDFLRARVGKLWWQRAWVSGWGFGRSADEWSRSPGAAACPEAYQKGGRCPSVISPQRLGGAAHAYLDAVGNAGDSSGLLRCVDVCLCLDASDACERPSCLLAVAESLVVKTAACDTRRNYTQPTPVQRPPQLDSSSNASAPTSTTATAPRHHSRSRSPPPLPSCVLRAPLLHDAAYDAVTAGGHNAPHAGGGTHAGGGAYSGGRAHNTHMNNGTAHRHDSQRVEIGVEPLLGPAFDLGLNVACYCAASTTSPALAADARMFACNSRNGNNCMAPYDHAAQTPYGAAAPLYGDASTPPYSASPPDVSRPNATSSRRAHAHVLHHSNRTSRRVIPATAAREEGSSLSNATRPGNGFLRCRVRVPLLPENTARPMAVAAAPQVSVWPLGCGGPDGTGAANATRKGVVLPLSLCVRPEPGMVSTPSTSRSAAIARMAAEPWTVAI